MKTANAVSSYGVVVTHTLERMLFLDLGLAINTEKYKIKKNIKKRCRGGMPKSMQTR